MASIRLDAVEKTYPGGHAGVRCIDLRVDDGEFLVLVGPSGCGKTTLLRVIAGLETPSSGRVLIGDNDVTMLPPQARDVAMVFQSYALYPHMSVRENLAYGLKVRGADRETVDGRVGTVAEALGIGALLDHRPAMLSGGQRQRVALGRAMVRQPRVFLLDEPLSNLDPSLRAQARAELHKLHQSLSATVVYVTHDQEEAVTLGGRVAVMRHGGIEQLAPPLDLYAKPANTFVAQFIGAPAMNLLPAPVPGIDAPAGALVGVRPQDVRIAAGGRMCAVVELVEPRGHDCVLHLRVDGVTQRIIAIAAAPAGVASGTVVSVAVPRDRIHLFDGRTGARLPA